MTLSFFKKIFNTKGYLGPLGTTLTVSGLGWFLHEIYATINTLQTIGSVELVKRSVKYIHVDEEITTGLVTGPSGFMEYGIGLRRLTYSLHEFRKKVAWRLLRQSEPGLRLLAARKLAAFGHLTDADRLTLAQACDAHTAVALARSRGAGPGLFLRPPPSSLYKIPSATRADLTDEMRDLLHKLNEESEHLCVKYFLLKAFPEDDAQGNYLLDSEVMPTEPWSILTSRDSLLPLCVQALDHFVSAVGNERALVEAGGPALLMEVLRATGDNDGVALMICRVLCRVSAASPGHLAALHRSGWPGVLAGWAAGARPPLALAAARCLANLDRDEACGALYGRHVVPLHPPRRAPPPLVDVVFVHGLLGGALSTWRQRSPEHAALALTADDGEPPARPPSDERTREYLLTLSELTAEEWDHLGDDFEFVVTDFPVSSTGDDRGLPYTLSGRDRRVRERASDKSYSGCWPRDWLPRDCPSLRVLGVDYESRLSEWFPTCSEKLRIKSLEERATAVLEELRRCGLGQRPTVWVAHSMGGLLVKKMLTKARVSADPSTARIAKNTEAVVFLSTPHLGCPLAKLNDVLSYLLWPSTEVEELRHNSRILNELHEEFQRLMAEVDMKIVTFAETKSTRISALGVDLHIVPPEFSFLDAGDVHELPCDHACVAKPRDRLSFIYQTVLRIVSDCREAALART